MTNEHITLLTQITDALLEVCDGAQEQDAQGFNKPDSLTVRGSYPDMIPIAPLLLKYKKQIEGAGFNFMSLKAAVIAVSGDLPTHNWNEYKIEFGKHSGRTYKEMADDQRGYLSWMVQTFMQDDMRWIAANAVLSEIPIPELKPPEPKDETIMLMAFGDGRIGVHAPYEQKERCQALSERRWEKPYWVCPAAIVEEVAAAFQDGEQSNGFKHKLDEVRAISEKAMQTESSFGIEHFGNGKELMPFQSAGLEFVEATGGNALIADQMGCISGNAMISVHRAGKSFKIRLDQLHMKFNHLGGNWKPETEIPTMARSLMPNETFRLNKVLNVIYKGEKDTVLIRTESGKELKLTPDHNVRTPVGWVEAWTLKIGSKILVNGKQVCKLCGSDKGVITYKYAKFRGFCKECMYRQLRDNALSHKRTVREHGKGTYISGGLKYHPHNTTGGIPEHRLIMEAKENGLSLNVWLEMLRTNNLDGYKFLSPGIEVHHINGDPHDNQVGNLQIVTKSEHRHIDDRYKNISDVFIPKEDIIISIEPAGIQRVFDIVMDEPAHNFIANGVVVHNCGKTVEALAYLALHPAMRPAVIVCPASLKMNWQREIDSWMETDEIWVIINSGKPYNLDKADIVIINYDILKKWLPELQRIEPEIMILDESHSVKNPKAARSKAAKELAAVVPHKILLTGTPVLNRPSELWNQLGIIRPDEYSSNRFFNWHLRYTAAHKIRIGRDKTAWDFSGASNLDELAQSLKSIMIRRTKEQVLPELPAKRRSTVLIPIDNRKEYDRADKEFVAWMTEQKGEAAAERASHVEQLAKREYLKQVAIKGKMKAAIEWIKTFLESGEKLIVFGTHRSTIESVMSEFSDCAVSVIGGMKAEAKDEAVKAFQNDPNIQLFVGNIQAAGVGLTLTAASNVAFLELADGPEMLKQCEDRCVLEGQPIMTADGWRPIEDIRVGDYVISSDGSPHQVIDAWNRLARSSHAAKSKDIVEIRVRGWQDAIKVTSDHQILTVRGWVEAQDIRPRDQILMPSQTVGDGLDEIQILDEYRCAITFETPQRQIFGAHYTEPRIKPATMQKNTRLIKLPDTIDLTDTAMFAFGYYIGDGHAYVGQDKGRYVSFAGNKTTKLPRMKCIQHWLNSYSINGTIYNDPNSEGCELRMYSSELAKFFAGEFGAKLKEKRVPEWIYRTSFEQRMQFVNGWLASDGYVRSPNGCTRNEIITASYRLAADASWLLMSIGKKPCIYYGKQAQAYTIGWTDGMAQSLVVTSITHRTCTKTERVYDLTVKAGSSFVIGTAVVHNCHRIGQENAVNCWYLLAENTIDGMIVDLVESKREVIDQITEEEGRIGFDLFELMKEDE